MNGHKHSTMQIQPYILMGMVRNHVAQSMRARWRLQALPEQFICLESSEPRVQLQEALKQIESLLQRNLQLLETTFLLSQALCDAHSLIHKDGSIGWSDRDQLRLLDDFHAYMKRLHGEIQMRALE